MISRGLWRLRGRRFCGLGSAFDPAVVDAFLSLPGEEIPGRL
jgi:hypothetical protein